MLNGAAEEEEVPVVLAAGKVDGVHEEDIRLVITLLTMHIVVLSNG